MQLWSIAGQTHWLVFATPFQADLYRNVAFSRPWIHEIVPLSWRDRERAKFDQGVYDPPIWKEEPFWINNRGIHEDHFVHVSLEDPTMLAYTESPEKGEADRQTRMKPGRYLQKFFSGVLTEKQIAFYAEWWRRGEKPEVNLNAELRFATTPDEIVEAYQDGPWSCMQNMDCVKVYGAGDLAIAYLHNGEDIVARALCWPEKKVFGRVYPTSDYWSRTTHLYPSRQDADNARDALFNQLRMKKGWTSIEEDSEIFEGARLLKIGHYDGYVMPYLDNGYGVADAGDHFVMTRDYEHPAENTCGYIQMEPEYEYECENCGDGCDEVTLVYQRNRSEYNYCSGCYDGTAYYCDVTDGSYDRRCVAPIRLYSGDCVNEEYFNEHGWTCAKTARAFLYDDDTPVELPDGDQVCKEWVEENCFYCDKSNTWYPKDEYESVEVDGQTWELSLFQQSVLESAA